MSETRMSRTEREAFLAAPHIGVLAIPSPDGAPLTAPIWYAYESGGPIQVLTGPESRKGRLLAEGTRVTLVAQQEALPYAYVSVEGTVVDIRAAEPADTQQMAVRYLGNAGGRQYAKANAGRDSLLVSIRPDRWLTVDYAKSPPI
jgi:PPOX class probable F420-dependent enzyme